MVPQHFVISSSRISSHSSSFSIAFRPVFGPWPPRPPSSDRYVFIYSLQNFNFVVLSSVISSLWRQLRLLLLFRLQAKQTSQRSFRICTALLDSSFPYEHKHLETFWITDDVQICSFLVYFLICYHKYAHLWWIIGRRVLRATLLLTELVKVLPKGKQTSNAVFKMASYWDISSARWTPTLSSRTV